LATAEGDIPSWRPVSVSEEEKRAAAFLPGKLGIPGSAVPDHSVGDNQKLSHARRASEFCMRFIIIRIRIYLN
jgi:hypothetical protein